MERFWRTLVGVLCICSYAIAQTKYEPQPISQTVHYDDEPSYYQQQENYGIARVPSARDQEKKYEEPQAPVYYKPISSPYPQPHSYLSSPTRHATYVPPKVKTPIGYPSSYEPAEPAYQQPVNQKYDKPDPKTSFNPYDQHEELQYSHEPEEPSYHHPRSKPDISYTSAAASYIPENKPSHYLPLAPETSYPSTAEAYSSGHQSNRYPSGVPATSYSPESYTSGHKANDYPSSIPETSHPSTAEADSSGHQSNRYPSGVPATSYSPESYTSRHKANDYPSAIPETSHPPAAEAYSSGHEPSNHPSVVPKTTYQPSSSPHQPVLSDHKTSLVKRDPRLPLYFTMYEKRIIQDPTDKYGKGPWRYLTYGHGITYGSKEPGKIFEKGYGYIRALGRDHCNLPENQCPPKDDKPFEYDGRKEPYFGYRPH